MRTLRLSLVGTVIVVVLGIAGVTGTGAQTQSSPEPSGIAAPVGEACEPVDLPFDPGSVHLSGVWYDSRDNIAYVSQVGSKIYLMHLTGRDETPERLGREFSVVAIGTLADDGTVALDYGMVPRGEWLFDDFGTITGHVVGQPGDPIQLIIYYPETAGRPKLTYVLRPCAPATRTTTRFEPAFTFGDEPRVGLSLVDGPGFAWLPASDHEGVESGVTVWSLAPTSAMTCEGSDGSLEPGATAFLAWLQSRADLTVSEPVPVTVDGRPATMVDVAPAPGATACLEDGRKVRLWSVNGMDSGVNTDSMTRVILMDVGDATLAIEMYGDDQDTWLPLAQKVVDTIHFTE